MCKEKDFEKKLLDFVTVELMELFRNETSEIFKLEERDSRLIFFEKCFYEEIKKILVEQKNSTSYEYYLFSCKSLNRLPSKTLKKVLIDSNIAPDGLMPEPKIKDQMKKKDKTIYSTVVMLIPKELPNLLYSVIDDLGLKELIEKEVFLESMLSLFKKHFNPKRNELSLRTIPKEELLKEIKLLLLNSSCIKPRYLIDESIIDAYYI
jgi:hypothetical protein